MLVRQLACGLARAGLKRGDHIVVVAENRPRLSAVMLAAVIANLIMIPHPVWFALVGVFGTIVAAFMAGDTSLRFLGKPE